MLNKDEMQIIPINDFNVMSPNTYQLLNDYDIYTLSDLLTYYPYIKIIDIDYKNNLLTLKDINTLDIFKINTLPFQILHLNFIPIYIDNRYINNNNNDILELQEYIFCSIVEYILTDILGEIEDSLEDIRKELLSSNTISNEEFNMVYSNLEMAFSYKNLSDLFQSYDVSYLKRYLYTILNDIIVNLDNNDSLIYSLTPLYWIDKERLIYV